MKGKAMVNNMFYLPTDPGRARLCDRCCGAAVASVMLPKGLLRFCEHHLRECRPALEAKGYRIYEDLEVVAHATA